MNPPGVKMAKARQARSSGGERRLMSDGLVACSADLVNCFYCCVSKVVYASVKDLV